MKIIEPNIELWEQKDVVEHVAKCARICYRKESGNDKALYDRLLKSNHLSMFRHESVYAITDININLLPVFITFKECPYIDFIICEEEKRFYIATNRNFMIDLERRGKTEDMYKYLHDYIQSNIVTPEQFANTDQGFKLMRYTFVIDTQISTSRELNRVSPNNISEQSTRYVYEDGTICRPHWISKEEAKFYNDNNNVDLDEAMNIYLRECNNGFDTYKILVDKYKINRQDARGVLPIDTATRCAYTYSIKQWRNIIDLRYYGTTGVPHPNAKIIAGMIKNKLIELGYEFR